mmetsp:Transcript_41130/g.127003  ORF Transcript_41130/g.127003 Transcript_41130/m.127003 type:complete len:264 (+) Transcript_41130:484-1275(+)
MRAPRRRPRVLKAKLAERRHNEVLVKNVQVRAVGAVLRDLADVRADGAFGGAPGVKETAVDVREPIDLPLRRGVRSVEPREDHAVGFRRRVCACVAVVWDAVGADDAFALPLAVELPSVERTAEAALARDGAAFGQVRAEMRAKRVEHGRMALVISEDCQLLGERGDANDFAGLETIGWVHREPAVRVRRWEVGGTLPATTRRLVGGGAFALVAERDSQQPHPGRDSEGDGRVQPGAKHRVKYGAGRRNPHKIDEPHSACLRQ